MEAWHCSSDHLHSYYESRTIPWYGFQLSFLPVFYCFTNFLIWSHSLFALDLSVAVGSLILIGNVNLSDIMEQVKQK